MGFSTAVASVILFAAFLFFASTVSDTMIEVSHETRRAEDARQERGDLERNTVVEPISMEKQGDQLVLEYLNQGGVVLQVSRTALFLDGSWRDPAGITHSVDSVTTDVWGPGQSLRLQTHWPGATPDRAWLVLETGRGVLSTP